MLDYENKYWNDGLSLVAGVDEAGRGPLAGDLYAAAVILKPNTYIEGINDSKKLSEKKREELFDVITKEALYYNIVSIDVDTIDNVNILEATYMAFQKALSGLLVTPQMALIDGNRAKGIDIPYELVIKGDAKCQSIAAASILAKVSRDRYMNEMAKKYPEYNFNKHKAYGTAEHRSLIAKYGPCPIHRKTFKGVKEYVK